MGYFSNGTEGLMYEEEYCVNCIHGQSEDGIVTCPIWDMQYNYNYEECNKPDSLLHELIPRGKDGLFNEQCVMFIAAQKEGK
jgi:hypothetical protein